MEDMGTCASEDVVEADDDMDHIAWMRKPIGQNCPWHKDISRLTVENVDARLQIHFIQLYSVGMPCY